MSNKLIQFDNKDVTIDDVGGKGLNLIKLYNVKSNLFNIPEGFIVPSKIYYEFIQMNKLSDVINEKLKNINYNDIAELERVSGEIRHEIERYQLPGEVIDEISANFSKINAPCAVRSSATAEDLEDLSFAGQHDTFLNIITLDDLLISVVKCFSSLWTARALQYRYNNKIEHSGVNIAVVVQKMVYSDYSGVIFTANPITGHRGEVVIEAIAGLGEALVSGIVTPDTYIVDADNKIRVNVGTQKKIILPVENGGTKTIERELNKQHLDDNLILKLHKISKSIEKYYGTPQDIEYGIKDNKIFILQSRAITTLFPIPDFPQDRLHLYVSFNYMQGVTSAFTPIGTDMLINMALGFGKSLNFNPNFYNQKVLFPINNRIWTDISYTFGNPIFRKLVVEFLGIAEPDTKKIVEQQLHRFKKIKFSHTKPGTLMRFHRGTIFFISEIKRILEDPSKAMKLTNKRIEQYFKILRKEEKKADTIEKKYELFKKMPYYIIRFILLDLAPYIGSGMSTLMQMKNIFKPEKLGFDYKDMIRSVPNNPTTQMNHYLWEICTEIKENKESTEYYLNNTTDKILDDYKNKKMPDVAYNKLMQFLDKYGFRGYAEIDIGKPRWIDDPKPVITHIKSYLQINDPEKYPTTQFEKAKDKPKEQYYAMFNHLLQTPAGNLKAKLYTKMIQKNRAVIGLRELPKFIWIKSLIIARDILYSLGKDIVKSGHMDNYRDIIYLYYKDLDAYMIKPYDLRSTIEENKSNYEKFQNDTRIPRIIMNTGEVYYYPESKIKLKEGQFKGSPVSSGIIEAPVRIVHKPDEGNLKPGEILVCEATDPSWTPLFQIASGLIMEIGGMMTHGSVVAREHGIPGIVAVKNATKIFKDGQIVRMNGNTGIIELIE